MKKYFNETMSSKSIKIIKSGNIPRVAKLDEVENIANDFETECKKRNITLDYDITYYTPEGVDSLSYTEFAASMGGFYIHSCNHGCIKEMFKTAIDENITTIDFSERIKSMVNIDKYKLRKSFYTKEQLKDGVIFLCGTNIMNLIIDFKLVDEAYKQGAYIKPHPLTRPDEINMLKEKYGDRIIGRNVSGSDLLLMTDKVFVPSSSELGIFATLLDKEVNIISNNVPRGAYIHVIEMITESKNPKEDLNKLLNSNKSGIFFVDDYKEEHMNEFLDSFEEQSLEYKIKGGK